MTEHDTDDMSAEESMLERLATSLVKSRSEAIEKRANSGIEQQWEEDEEFYEGIDDANRAEVAAWSGKPLGQPGIKTNQSTGSTIFANITRPYCDAASARTADMILPVDDKSWSIKPTPLPNLDNLASGKVPDDIRNQVSAYILDIKKQLTPEQALEEADVEINRIIEQARAIVKDAKEKAERAEKRIMDWQIESQYHSELRLVIEDAAKIGSGVLKGPYPDKRRTIAYKGGQLIITEEIVPVSRRIDYRNFYPDPGCGENIHDGGFTWERDDITDKKLRNLIGVPGYIKEQIEKVLQEGPHRAGKIADAEDPTSCLTKRDTDNLYEIWYYHGTMKVSQLRALMELSKQIDEENSEADQSDDDLEGREESEIVGVQVTMINNRIIRAAFNPLDTGEFPYDIMVWQKKRGMPWGIGVARQMREPQRIVVAAIRAMMDNAGRAAGGQILFDPEYIAPATGSTYELKPWGAWKYLKSLDGQKTRQDVFDIVSIDMQQGPLQSIVMLALKLAEDVTGMPVIMQGQVNQSTPDTLGGMQIQNNNASTVMRRFARLFDDLITEPHTRRYYTYLLQHGPSDDEKGDFSIDARGSSALMEREIQNQQILSLGQMVQNPIYGIDPKKWIKQYFSSQRLDYHSFEYDDEEWRQIVERMLQPPADPRTEIAQLNAEMRKEVEQFREQSRQAIEQMRLQDKQAEREHESAENERDREVQLIVEQMREEVDAMSLGSNKQINLDKIKASLAEVAAKLNVQRELSGIKAAQQTITPPTEPAGRAPAGEAFAR